MAGAGQPWSPVTVVRGPAGVGKTHLVRSRVDPARDAWLTFRDQHDGTELASRLVRHLRIRLPTLPASLTAAVGPSTGPVGDAEPAARAAHLGALIADALHRALDRELVLVLDELERADGDAVAMRLVESLVRSAPRELALVLVTRTDVPFSTTRLRADARLEEVLADDLLLAPATAHRLLGDRWLELATDHELVEGLLDLAGGRAGPLLAAAALLARTEPDARPRLLADLTLADEPLVEALARGYDRLEPDGRRLVHDLAVFAQASATDLGRLGHDRAASLLADLTVAQLVEVHPGTGRFQLSRAAATAVAPDDGIAASRAPDAIRLAIGRGDPGAGVAIALRHGGPGLLADTVATLGPAAIDAGHARLVLDATEALPDAGRLHGLAGRAAHALGDGPRAATEFRAAADVAIVAADAWRHGLLEYFQGDPTGALEIYERAIAEPHPDDAPADRAMLVGYAGAAAWLTGDLDAARRHAEKALELATSSRDDAAQAAAYTLAALVAASDGDRVSNDWHYVRALQHAERAGDVLQIARIRSNRGSRLLEEGDYDAALAELDDAVRHADLGGFGAVLALALANRGEVLTRLGRLDDARTDLTTAVDLLQRQGSRIVAYPMVGLARLFVVRGDVEQARSAGERALAMSDSASDRQLGVAVRVQLARALADRQPDLAWEHARAAAAGSDSLDAAEAWAVVGLLALGRGDRTAAIEAATTATEIARARRDRFALASAIEIRALATADTDDRARLLEEAHTLFDELGCPLDAGRVEVRMAADRLDTMGVTRVAAVAELAQRLGARPLLAQAEEVLRIHRSDDDGVLSVSVLGSFGVRVRGEPVPLGAWQSKKARDLFKMLVVLRGRPLPRDQAAERLWPDDDIEKVGSKLSVALATIRAVLDPDKEFPADRYVQADGEAIRINETAMTTDVGRFLSTAADALAHHRRAPGARSTAMLTACEAAYTGDLLEADPYVDWFVTAREEARAVYLNVTRELAAQRSADGEIDDAIRLLLRVLEREPYDEPAHLDLVAALTRVGRHGDARRRYEHYVERMRELDLEPRSFPETGGP